MARASALHAEGQGFESLNIHHRLVVCKMPAYAGIFLIRPAPVPQFVIPPKGGIQLTTFVVNLCHSALLRKFCGTQNWIPAEITHPSHVAPRWGPIRRDDERKKAGMTRQNADVFCPPPIALGDGWSSLWSFYTFATGKERKNDRQDPVCLCVGNMPTAFFITWTQ